MNTNALLSIVTLFLAIASETQAIAEVVRPIEMASVIRPVHAAHRKAFEALPQAAVIMSDPPSELAAIASAFSVAHVNESFIFPFGTKLCVLSTGPVLDSPDRVEIRGLTQQATYFELNVVHTQVRLQDAALLRNILWRPMVKVCLPNNLPFGEYDVRVIWQAVDKLPDGQPLTTQPISETTWFNISDNLRAEPTK